MHYIAADRGPKPNHDPEAPISTAAPGPPESSRYLRTGYLVGGLACPPAKTLAWRETANRCLPQAKKHRHADVGDEPEGHEPPESAPPTPPLHNEHNSHRVMAHDPVRYPAKNGRANLRRAPVNWGVSIKSLCNHRTAHRRRPSNADWFQRWPTSSLAVTGIIIRYRGKRIRSAAAHMWHPAKLTDVRRFAAVCTHPQGSHPPAASSEVRPRATIPGRDPR
jgi:hypothetical protein